MCTDVVYHPPNLDIWEDDWPPDGYWFDPMDFAMENTDILEGAEMGTSNHVEGAEMHLAMEATTAVEGATAIEGAHAVKGAPAVEETNTLDKVRVELWTSRIADDEPPSPYRFGERRT